MKKASVLSLLVALPGLLFGQVKPTTEQKVVVFTNVTVIDVTGGPEQTNTTVVVSGDRITQLGRTRKIHIPKGAHVVDSTGKFLIPGLWDMHVHTLHKNRLGIFFALFVANGVLGVRDMHTPAPIEQVNQWRNEIAAGTLLGPRIVAAGPIVDGPNPMDPSSIVVTNESEAPRSSAFSQAARG